MKRNQELWVLKIILLCLPIYMKHYILSSFFTLHSLLASYE